MVVGKIVKVKNKNITPAYFNNVFGVTPTGPNINNKSVDGSIRALITQAATITANQNIREDAMSNSSNPFDVIALIGDGKSELMFSKEESPRIKNKGNKFIMHYNNVFNEDLPFDEFTSDKVVVSKNELDNILSQYNYFNETKY